LAYSESRTSSKIAHLHSIYSCTYGILFFGTPHHGSNKAHLVSSLQKLADLTIPKALVQTESALINALEEDSEILQNITDQFVPLMSNFRIYYFWEQERTDLKYTRDYVVNQSSAAPIFDNTERCGIAADHQHMCKFDSNTSQGFRTAVAALKKYTSEAPATIRVRNAQVEARLKEKRHDEAMEILRGASVFPC
jgi:protein SERAC1